MLFVTAAMIGVCAGLMRSAPAAIIAALLIPVSFGAAALLAPVSPFDLLVAILGYNAGLAQLFIGAVLLQRRVAD